MLYDFAFSTGPHYYIHAWDVENFFPLQLGIAPHDYHGCMWILPNYSVDEGAIFAIGCTRYAAGIDDTYVGRGALRSQYYSQLSQLPTYGRGLCKV